ncbi:LEAF RUST 10 DISEASE-RESISTANCE LOCUS RECEPTOR-LIKE PROTEIN KINASE-like 2.7 isoform X2 [Salvia miltiorrhiza]|uniref:LEAF RUST 10 DISEASE-RESISTANCE LOCUS RECEPTOR-LIKE PROTEIN KINASE-like 2.7 isoform X2 n=1 Tax=Salvia miltiorrhiza TaxID=226208 RepID=UPI0025AD8B19|nr:LEAF RUST 10 DISEASE-RESISTANCE LOCUS RECEPTOR-LIKE PROTEIN KINASE-like 2.7 isoform X2 [Salvia miltiorrhiza]
MISENHLLAYWSLLIILLLHSLQSSHASLSCSPSRCGIIPNISDPFRLKDDPKNCGDPKYELACENNVAFMYLNSQKYLVKAVNYGNSTIRLADPSINDDTCSFPKHSTYAYNFSGEYPFSTYSDRILRDESVAWPINFVSCPYRLEDSSNFTEITDCVSGENSFGASNLSRSRYTYVKVGRLRALDIGDKCDIDLIVMTSWKFKNFKNVTLSKLHDALLYGFELSWLQFRCIECKGGWECTTIDAQLDGCTDDTFRLKIDPKWEQSRVLFSGLFWLVLFLLLVIGFRLEVLIIAGFTCAWGLLILSNFGWFFNSVNVISYAAKIIIAYPCVMGLVIYKFRRRHQSMFDDIEGFLQSDNELVPIRYSYSELKKMTRGFQEKLGEGGFGAVYKGKLQSGHDVAVKLLGKAGANSQDFFNEISTIGRIHHVNIVKLVGYCAERSKRALILDFMPNGSLEKYIFNREKMNSLNWDRKFEIAVGVARGIEYLHRGCDIQILHFDIKPHNILLDDKFIPKISDFGLAKFYSTEKKTVTMTAARGTIGYVAPELISRSIGAVSYKADVYSFGMLLMEMVGLKRDLKGNAQNSSQYFPYWIYDSYNQGKEVEFGNGNEINDEDNERVKKTIRKMTIVALWCIQMNPNDRPSMNKVLEMLEGNVECLRIPDRPSESIQVAVSEDQTFTTTTTTTSSSTDHVSLLRPTYTPSSHGISVQDSQSFTLSL